MRILIVEDEVRLAEALGQIMEEQRYLPDLTYNGPDGLEYALTGQYDVIILDVMLPGMDGLEVARRLREAALRCRALPRLGLPLPEALWGAARPLAVSLVPPGVQYRLKRWERGLPHG